MHSRLSVRKGTYGISHTEMFMRRNAGYGAVERIVYNNFTKIYIRNPFRQEPERIFYAIKRILRMAPSEHYGNYVRTCLNEKPRLKYGLHILLFYRN